MVEELKESVNMSPPTLELVKCQLTDKEIRYHRWYMDSAMRAAEMSHCTRRKVGAIVVQEGNPISTGWNGMPEGFPNGCELEDGTTNPAVRHAERNALERFMSRTDATKGGSMYVTTSPCIDCSITIKTRAKLARVYFNEFYLTTTGIEYLLNNNVEVYQLRGEEMFQCKLSS